MASIEDIVSPQYMQGYWENYKSTLPPFYGETIYPSATTDGDTLDYIVGADSLPISMNTSNFDQDTVFMQRPGFDTKHLRIPFHKNGLAMDETTRKKLQRALKYGDATVIDTLRTKVFDDQARLLISARNKRERMAMSAFTTGKLALTDNGTNYTVNYGVPANHFGNSLKGWSDPTADIETDIQNVEDLLTATTGAPQVMVMNTKTFRSLQHNKEIINTSIIPSSSDIGMLPANAVSSFLQDTFQVQIVVYNQGYYDAKGKFQNYIPDDTVIFTPSGALGNMTFTQTPEELDLTSDSAVQTSIVDNGVAISVWKKPDPVVTMMKVSQQVVPSFPQANSVYILKVGGGK